MKGVVARHLPSMRAGGIEEGRRALRVPQTLQAMSPRLLQLEPRPRELGHNLLPTLPHFCFCVHLTQSFRPGGPQGRSLLCLLCLDTRLVIESVREFLHPLWTSACPSVIRRHLVSITHRPDLNWDLPFKPQRIFALLIYR